METAILVRHAESELSVRGRTNGDPARSVPLTATGVAQARALRAALAAEPLDLCVTSEFERVRETAELALAERDVPRLVLADLNDVRFGSFEGEPLSDYRRWAGANGPTTAAPGGGESRAGTVERYVRAYRTILARPERTVLVVTHGLPIRYVLNALEERDPAPIVDNVPYAEPFHVGRDALARAVARLERWAAEPVWT